LGNTPENIFGGENHLLQRTTENKRVILPQGLYSGCNTNAVGKNAKPSCGTGKEVMGNLPQNFLAAQDGSGTAKLAQPL